MVVWVFSMQEVGLSISLQQLKMKVEKLTQTRLMPFQKGVPRSSWQYWFKRRNHELNIHQAEGLDNNQAQGLIIQSCQSFYQNLQSLYNKHNYVTCHI